MRGTTLRQSIISILDRLGPKKIVIVSSSPQVRYPDYYGIDMSRMSDFIAFKAAIELLKDREMRNIIASAYRKSKEQADLPKEQMVNYVKDIYPTRKSPPRWLNCSLRRARRPRFRLSTNPLKACTRPVPTIRATGTSVATIPRRAE